MHSWFEDTSKEQGLGWDFRFADFLADLQMQEGLADTTILKLQQQITAFNRWLLSMYGRSWEHATKKEISEYLQGSQTDLKNATLQSRRWSLKRFYCWANSEGIASVNPRAFDYYLSSHRKTETKLPLSVDAIDKLLAQPNTDSPKGLRDKAIMELLYATGMRASEILSLDIYQITSDNYLKVWGKYKKERLVLFGEQARDCIAQYIKARRELLLLGGHKPTATDKLFVSTGKYPNYQYYELRRMINRYAQQCGLKITPHSLRHAFATHMYQSGAELSLIQTLLGHEYLQTSTIYIGKNTKNFKRLLKQHHPRGMIYRKRTRLRQEQN